MFYQVRQFTEATDILAAPIPYEPVYGSNAIQVEQARNGIHLTVGSAREHARTEAQFARGTTYAVISIVEMVEVEPREPTRHLSKLGRVQLVAQRDAIVENVLPKLTEIELATVLTGLRTLQAGKYVSLDCDILTDDGIDELCENINCGSTLIETLGG